MGMMKLNCRHIHGRIVYQHLSWAGNYDRVAGMKDGKGDGCSGCVRGELDSVRHFHMSRENPGVWLEGRRTWLGLGLCMH